MAAGLALVTLLLAGCSNDPLAEQYREGSDKGYIAGDGTVTEIAEANRQDPVEFTGTDENGDPISSADYAGQVLVLNFWYAGCAPCRAEAPDLEKLNAEYQGTGASFLGVNVRDQAATARSFAETYGVTYPSVVDTDGALQYAFAGTVAPNAVPTTLVIDTEGRVAARILGRVSEPTILDTLIKTSLGVLPEPGATSSPSPTPAAG
ncbi:TlpA family protein disulfide reductase [Herbiconiux sp. CPCC 205716]|uniref:TlpA family protein disulfide reductase n=1 Tax=Herbiconiux gentiana TaxID=2970912 RepID=A0ABT2GH85_9MICO|nr:TlpA disulfide reductase family protein [Herbiconiux gentiana]MCS5715589.1 TlpA family protein disulfide reductase [Herbiconiux gentiana]